MTQVLSLVGDMRIWSVFLTLRTPAYRVGQNSPFRDELWDPLCRVMLLRTETGGLLGVSDQWPWASTAAPETRLCEAVWREVLLVLGNAACVTESGIQTLAPPLTCSLPWASSCIAGASVSHP